MPAQDTSLYKRLYQHAQKRLVFEPGVARGKQLPAYKRYVELEEVMLERQHRQGKPGREVCQARAAMTDVVIENLFLAALDFYTTNHGIVPYKMGILATGGYGRRELNPHSDIDIMFLYPVKAKGKDFSKFQEIITEEILYPLWDLGWKVGHASRNSKEVIEECRKEIQSKNAILESRLICGSGALQKTMRKQFDNFCKEENSKAYIEQRLEDEKVRHSKSGDTIYLQEPDIKNGVGGLRDYQNILWMAFIKYGFTSFRDLVEADLLREDEYVAIIKAYDFLLRTRTELHLQNRRPTDKLDLEQQPIIAQKLNYDQENIFLRVESFMKDYYTAARDIYQTSVILKERMAIESTSNGSERISFSQALRAYQHLPSKLVDGFRIHQNVIGCDNTKVFEEEPLRLIRIFRLAQQYGAKIESDLRYLITRSVLLIDHTIINSSSAAKSFCAILRSPGEVYPILMQMHELGILGRYMPEFDALTCMVQHEYYHRYTADAHVLRTIRHLDRVFSKHDEEYARYEKELRKNDDPLLLYLILLLHDMGKAEGIKSHEISGVRIAQLVLDRLGIGKKQQEQILFIVRSHLEMARFWQRFDLDDPKTAESFSQFIEDPEKLRFLYVHTYCDSRGTAPTLWNSYKDTMHRALYMRTTEQFGGNEFVKQKQNTQIVELNKELLRDKIKGVSKEEVEAHYSMLPERYFINTESSEIQLHLQMVNRLLTHIQTTDTMASLAPIIDWRNDIDLNMTIVNTVTWDRSGLFYKQAGALTLAGVNIVSTKAVSRKDHISINTFYILGPDGGVVSDSESKGIFERRLSEALIDNKEHMPEISKLEAEQLAITRKDMLPAPFPPSVDVYHELSLKQTIVEVQASDRIGLLYQISRRITKEHFDISFARIATERGVAMDTFYIKNENPKKETDTATLLELRNGLDKILRELSVQ